MLLKILFFLLSLPCLFAQESSLDQFEYKTGEKFTQEGDAFLKENKLDDAILAYKRAIVYGNGNAKAHFGLGNALERKGDVKDAIHQYQSALIFQPGFIQAYNKLGMLFEKNKEQEKAFTLYLKAFALDPLFSREESREQVKPSNLDRELKEIEVFKKTPLSNQSIYISSKGSLKDIVLAARYLLLLKEKGAHVTFTCPYQLRTLFENSIAIDYSEGLEGSYDLKCDLSALPTIFDTKLSTIPYSQGYLKPTTSQIKAFDEWIAKKPLRIGIAIFDEDEDRSISLSQLTLFKTIPSASFYLLQSVYNKNEWDLINAELDISKLTENFDPLDEVAAAISHLDLVIATDNTIAAVAAALGKPCWILLSKNPDWPWFLEGSSSPWYKSVQLFRQTQEGDWSAPLQEILVKISGINHLPTK